MSREGSTPPCAGTSPADPVFAEPWQARAFALMLKLREHGHFTATEWSTELGKALRDRAASEEIPRGEISSGDDPAAPGETAENSSYYAQWLSALESLVLAKGLTDQQTLLSRKEAWADAYRHTPHGKPVELG